jgi:hypothetical protein
MIKNLIEAAFAQTAKYWETAEEALRPKMWPPTPFSQGIPTLAPDVFRPSSPMLEERFQLFGRWTTASHGHWLSTSDMETLWSDRGADPFVESIKQMQVASAEGWPNDASALFRPERLSLFAGSEYNNERIYLLWLDFEDEPELWVYDTNGESRYRDLASYLQAYLAEDVSAASRSWRA